MHAPSGRVSRRGWVVLSAPGDSQLTKHAHLPRRPAPSPQPPPAGRRRGHLHRVPGAPARGSRRGGLLQPLGGPPPRADRARRRLQRLLVQRGAVSRWGGGPCSDGGRLRATARLCRRRLPRRAIDRAAKQRGAAGFQVLHQFVHKTHSFRPVPWLLHPPDGCPHTDNQALVRIMPVGVCRARARGSQQHMPLGCIACWWLHTAGWAPVLGWHASAAQGSSVCLTDSACPELDCFWLGLSYAFAGGHASHTSTYSSGTIVFWGSNWQGGLPLPAAARGLLSPRKASWRDVGLELAVQRNTWALEFLDRRSAMPKHQAPRSWTKTRVTELPARARWAPSSSCRNSETRMAVSGTRQFARMKAGDGWANPAGGMARPGHVATRGPCTMQGILRMRRPALEWVCSGQCGCGPAHRTSRAPVCLFI
jgi:hypothetical protein